MEALEQIKTSKMELSDDMLEDVTGGSKLWQNIKKVCDEFADWVKSKY